MSAWERIAALLYKVQRLIRPCPQDKVLERFVYRNSCQAYCRQRNSVLLSARQNQQHHAIGNYIRRVGKMRQKNHDLV